MALRGAKFDSEGYRENYGDDEIYETASSVKARADAGRSQAIHILGVGSLGTFVAHSLAGIPNRPPITLLLKGVEHLRNWKTAKESLSVITRGRTDTRTGFDVELLPYRGAHVSPYQSSFSGQNSTRASGNISVEASSQGKSPSESAGSDVVEHTPSKFTVSQPLRPDEDGNLLNDFDREVIRSRSFDKSTIHHLIVCTSSAQTVFAVKDHAHRLNEQSSILFLQSGLGVVDEVNQVCFPDPLTRPQYLIGVNTHGLKREGKFFDVRHTLEGSIALGILPQPYHANYDTENRSTPLDLESSASQYLIRTMTRTPALVCARYPPTDLLQLQLDRLAIDSVVGPLTALLGLKNGVFYESYNLTRTLRLLLAETCNVIRNLPELKNVPNAPMRYDNARVERKLFLFIRNTAKMESRMLQAVRSHIETDVDYVNGYIIKRGEELGIYCVMNYMLLQLIKTKTKFTRADKNQDVAIAQRISSVHPDVDEELPGILTSPIEEVQDGKMNTIMHSRD